MGSLQQIVTCVVSVGVLLISGISQPFLVMPSHPKNNHDSEGSENGDRTKNRECELRDLIGIGVVGYFCLQGRQVWERSVVAVVTRAAFHVVNPQSGSIALLGTDIEVALQAIKRQVLVLRCAAPRDSLVASGIPHARLPARQGVKADSVVGRVVAALCVIAHMAFISRTVERVLD